MKHHKLKQNGFALLISLIVVSVVISIGLTVLDLTLKQLKLSTNSKDSETAFHAANAGLECARYWRNVASDAIEVGNNFNPSCFGLPSLGSVSADEDTDVSGGGEDYVYRFESTWGTAPTQRCSEMTMLVIVADISELSEIDADELQAIFPGYPVGDLEETDDKLVCESGSFCTIISSKGYSRSCESNNLPGTVQREVLLEL